jgi:hypothetical protein
MPRKLYQSVLFNFLGHALEKMLQKKFHEKRQHKIYLAQGPDFEKLGPDNGQKSFNSATPWLSLIYNTC